jgi:hypothetical protein
VLPPAWLGAESRPAEPLPRAIISARSSGRPRAARAVLWLPYLATIRWGLSPAFRTHPQHWWRSQRSQNDSSALFSITYKPTKGFWTGMGDFRGWETHLQIKWAWILQHGLLAISEIFSAFGSLVPEIWIMLVLWGGDILQHGFLTISENFSAFGRLVPEIWVMLVLGGDILQHGLLNEFCSVLFDFFTVWSTLSTQLPAQISAHLTVWFRRYGLCIFTGSWSLVVCSCKHHWMSIHIFFTYSIQQKDKIYNRKI